jgi:hypothetical protein
MFTQNSQKFSEDFICLKCDYITSRKSDYKKHIYSDKHKMLTNVDTNSQKVSEKKIHVCVCGKKYSCRQSLSVHKKKCNITYNSDINEPITSSITPELVFELIKDNKDLKEIIIEQSKTIQDLAKNMSCNINNIENHNNSHNTFNLQIYLNEHCKNAMNISEFADTIKVQISDLERTGRLGYVEGISDVVSDNLKVLDSNERPIHCSDLRREIFYIKDNNQWVKENENKDKLKEFIKQIAKKNMCQISEWIKLHPDCLDSESRKNDQYLHIVSNSMSGGTIEEQKSNMDKIISRVAKKVVINKNDYKQ